MDKTKVGGILALVALAGLLAFSKSQEPPAPEADPDHHDSAAASAPITKDGVDLAGGVMELKTEDERTGTGAVAEPGDTLTVNYKGSLLDGRVFDQSYGRQPFVFPLGQHQVIQGWDQGLGGMKVGGKRKLTIPASLGYGENGSPPVIPGGATLVFEVELLKVQKTGEVKR